MIPLNLAQHHVDLDRIDEVGAAAAASIFAQQRVVEGVRLQEAIGDILGGHTHTTQSNEYHLQLISWSRKPPPLSPLECASHGYVAIEYDLLQCVDCKSFVSARLPALENVNERELMMIACQ